MEAQEILAKLEARRKTLKMSARVLAERSGLSLGTVQAVLRRKSGATLDTVSALSEALGVRIGLVGESRPSAMRRRQARAKARRLAAAAQGSAALEAQAVDADVLKRAERRIEKQLLSGPPLRRWA